MGEGRVQMLAKVAKPEKRLIFYRINRFRRPSEGDCGLPIDVALEDIREERGRGLALVLAQD